MSAGKGRALLPTRVLKYNSSAAHAAALASTSRIRSYSAPLRRMASTTEAASTRPLGAAFAGSSCRARGNRVSSPPACSAAHAACDAANQGLTIAHVTAQLEHIRDTEWFSWVTWGTRSAQVELQCE